VRRAGIAREGLPGGHALETLLDAFLDRSPSAAGARFTLAALVLVGYWFLLDWTAGFPVVLPPEWTAGLAFPLDPLLDLLASLFAPQVLVHLLPVAAAIWLSWRIAAHYLSDLFELESFGTAMSYLGSSVVGLGSQALAIDRASVDEYDQAHPLVRIGGPGVITVHLGYAAVFETVDGEPRVYAPGRRQLLQGFERLRAVVDLRDQIRSVPEIRCVTLDGIEILARQAQVAFRVYTGGRPRTLQDPYPFTEESVRRLVYGQPVAESGPQPWTEALPGLLEAELQSLVGRLTLEEFLSLQGTPRDETPEGAQPGIHISPHRLTETLHTEEARRRLREQGLELAWASVGSWELRGLAEPQVSESLLQTWKDRQRARQLRTPQAVDRILSRARWEASSLALRELLDAWRAAQGQPRNARAWAWTRGVLQQLLQMRMEAAEGLETVEGLEDTLEHLKRLVEPLTLGSEPR
jgi:hypothetical protein